MKQEKFMTKKVNSFCCNSDALEKILYVTRAKIFFWHTGYYQIRRKTSFDNSRHMSKYLYLFLFYIRVFFSKSNHYFKNVLLIYLNTTASTA